MNMIKIIPSVFNADLLNLRDDIVFLEKNHMDILHIDMMDGNYVPNIAFGPDQIKRIKENTSMKIDVHLMVARPEKIIDRVIDAGADFISIHYESTLHAHEVVKNIKNKGVRAGIALNPATPPAVLKYMIEDIDFVLLMSINPGHWNQQFIDNIYGKIKETKELIDNRMVEIEIDGRMDPNRIKKASNIGASMFVVGSYLFDGDKKENILKLQKILK
ncbi:ribulose-phosphate 3-epimerase [Propionispira arboris]|uniref:Ribulose-phosphate 3-epimerase n=1 Tax=Propionispira arboris TaxID=84035 RepID=A0A1H7D9G3_9FIRM|nr:MULTISPECIES: ribulose-phosphate 3-epimerase [Propionispira]SEJ94845.1 ribulose-phosphate 3-epimerase [Propionispira arboris]